MIFTSFEFILFFFIVVLVGNSLRSFGRVKWFLLAASYIFYMSWNIPCVFLILATSVVNFFIGMGIGGSKNHRRRKILLLISIGINIGVLGYFKYTNFLLNDVWATLRLLGVQVNPRNYDIILPIGISFFTFQTMTYTMEVYRGNMQSCRNVRDFLLFVAFFPQLLAGPINRAANLLPQIKQRIHPTVMDFEVGITRFGMGAVKKLVISDRIAPHVDLIFAAPGNYDSFTLLQGLLGYAVQIYCDFSGYSDMAIGCARILGFRFMENFQMPYSSVNIAEFWRRWHISLSTWFRDYLYIPLGGNRKGSGRTYINLMITMLLCGLWHGASWNFVLWGAIHGFSLAIHRAWKNWNPFGSLKKYHSLKIIGIFFSRFLTLSVVFLGWLFFRAQSWADARLYFSRLATWSQDGTPLHSPYIILALFILFLIHLLYPKDHNFTEKIPEWSIPRRIANYTTLALLIACLGATDSTPFIYFNF